MTEAFYSFLAGLLSFLSPCVLPLLPSYLVYIGAISLNDSSSEFKGRKISIYNTLSFIFGFSLVFVSLGLAGSAIGKFFISYREYLVTAGGLILLIFGLYTIGLLNLPFLSRYISLEINRTPHGILGSFILGITFSLGWTPCIGPALSSVLILAMTSQNTMEAFFFLSLYSLGLGIPFFVSSLAVNKLLGHFTKLASFTKYAKLILGILIVAIGLTMLLAIYRPLIPRL